MKSVMDQVKAEIKRFNKTIRAIEKKEKVEITLTGTYEFGIWSKWFGKVSLDKIEVKE